jgi:GTP cyclohydrolase II
MPIPKSRVDDLLERNENHLCKGIKGICVKIVAIGDLPSRFGHFQVVAFYNNMDGKEHAAFVKGDVTAKQNVPVRLHSECLTGDAIGSLRCDCRDQLEKSLKTIGEMDEGILLYLRQEGRGIGFINKIKAYQLQDGGADTVEANIKLGFKDDERDYAIAAHMLKSLEVKSIRLLTNNPRKIKALTDLGISITDRIPIIIPPNEYNARYLHTKMEKSHHMLQIDPKEQVDDIRQGIEKTDIV